MSTRNEEYFGLYIELEYKTHNKNTVTPICPNKHVLRNLEDNFCYECGAKITTGNTLIKEKITYDDMIKQKLISTKTDDFYVVNIESSGKTCLILNKTNSKYGVFLLNAEYGTYSKPFNYINKMINTFNLEFNDLLTNLREHCKSVNIQYGLVKFHI